MDDPTTTPTASSGEREYQWTERRWHTHRAPAGQCWSVREMCSYTTALERFIPHLQAMAEGLERAYYSECDYDADRSHDSDDDYGVFVIGLRPMTPEDKTEDMLRAERQEYEEREQLAHLMDKYGDPAPAAPSSPNETGQ